MTLLYGPVLKIAVFSTVLLFRTVTTFNTTIASNDTFCQGPPSLARLLLCTRYLDNVRLQESERLVERKECPQGNYVASNGACRNCHLYGDHCTMTSQCCQTDHLVCWNFSALAFPSCICENGYTWDADSIRCYLPVTLPQQLLLIAAYSILGVMIALGVTATLVHVFGNRCGFCRRVKSHGSEEESGDLDYLRDPEVSEREMPPPYSPLEPPASQLDPQAAGHSAVHAGLGMALPITVSHRPVQSTPSELPPAYDVIAQSLIIHVHPTSADNVRFERSVSFRRDSIFSTSSSHGVTSPVTTDVATIAEEGTGRSATPEYPLPESPTPPNSTPPAASTSNQPKLTIVTSSNSPDLKATELQAVPHNIATNMTSSGTSSTDDLYVQSVPQNVSKPSRKASSVPSRKLSSIYEASSSGMTSSAPDLSMLSDDPESRPRVKFDYAKFVSFQRSNNMSTNFQPSTDLSSFTSPACQM